MSLSSWAVCKESGLLGPTSLVGPSCAENPDLLFEAFNINSKVKSTYSPMPEGYYINRQVEPSLSDVCKTDLPIYGYSDMDYGDSKIIKPGAPFRSN